MKKCIIIFGLMLLTIGLFKSCIAGTNKNRPEAINNSNVDSTKAITPSVTIESEKVETQLKTVGSTKAETKSVTDELKNVQIQNINDTAAVN